MKNEITKQWGGKLSPTAFKTVFAGYNSTRENIFTNARTNVGFPACNKLDYPAVCGPKGHDSSERRFLTRLPRIPYPRPAPPAATHGLPCRPSGLPCLLLPKHKRWLGGAGVTVRANEGQLIPATEPEPFPPAPAHPR